MPFVTDTFTDADNTAITSHTGETGATWTKHPTLATDGTAPKVSSNALVAGETSGSNAIYYASGSPASADYSSRADITLATSSSVADGPAIRINTAAGTGYFGLLFTAGGSVALYKYVTGTLTAISSLTVSLTTGVTYRTTIGATGTALTLRVQRLSDNQYLNSSATWQSGATDCISTTDSSISAAGKAGFWMAQSATASTWDNFSADDPGGGGSSGLAAGIYHRLAGVTH